MKKLLLSIGIGVFSMFSYAQMSGTYTLDPGQAASSTNFISYDALFDELTSSGVDGPVTVNVAEGTISEYVYRSNEEIPGASDTSAVTIQSDPNNSNAPILTWGGNAMYWYFCDFEYLTFDGINFRTTSSFGRPVYIRYGTQSHVTFSNCIFDHPTFGSTSYFYAGMYVERVTADNWRIIDNEFNYGGAGVTIRYNYDGGNDSTFVISGNDINNAKTAGIWAQYYDMYTHISDNDIQVNGTSTAYGIYAYYLQPGSRISGNNIEVQTSFSSSWSVSAYGVYNYYMGRPYGGSPNTGDVWLDKNTVHMNNTTGQRVTGIHNYYMSGVAAGRGKVANNMVSTSSGFQQQYGIYNYLSNYTDVINNNIYLGTTSSSGYALYHYTYTSSYSNGTVYNNIFRTASTSPYQCYVYDPYSFAGGGNNIFFSGNTTSMKAYWRTAPNNNFSVHYNLNSFETLTGIGGCMILDPQYVSNTDLHLDLSNLSLIEPIDGSGFNVGLTEDIDGESRIVAIPDIGADEFGAPNNASPGTPISPALPTCDANSCLTTTVVNTGTQPLTSVNVHWSINGVAQPTVNWTGNLAPGTSDTLDLTCTQTWQDGDELRIFTALPNGVVDQLAGNDTIDMALLFGLAGTYSIPGNYASIADAVTAVNDRGVCSATIFDIAPGTYTGDSIDLRNIIGVSDSNTVTWRSSTGNADDVVIQYAGNFQTNFVVNLQNADWQIFEDLTIENTSTSYGRVVSLAASDNNSFDRCKLISPTVTTTSSNMAVVYTGSNGNQNIAFRDNYLSGGGYAAFYILGNNIGGEENWIIENNEVENFYYMGVYCRYHDGMQFTGNSFQNTGVYTNSYGIYSWYCNGSKIERNTIGNTDVGSSGFAYGIYYYYSDGTGGDRNRIANNCISVGRENQANNGYYGIYMYGSDYVDVHGNTSTRLGGQSTSTAYAAHYQSQSYATSIVNNSFVDYVNNNAISLYTGFGITEFENNNVYSLDSTNLILWEGTAVASLEDFQAASGLGESSISVDPMFGDTVACATCMPTLNDLGTTDVSSNVDLNNNTRSTTTPDIGAVEYYPLAGFELGADSVVCATELEINLSPTANTTWSVNGQVINNSIATLTTTGETEEFEIFLNINSEACGLITDQVTYTLVPNAMLDSNMHLCADESAVLNPGGSATDSYVWSNGETTPAIEITEGGVYTVSKEGMGCMSSATILVTQSVGVNVEDAEDCSSNGAIAVDATVFNGVSYAWSAGNSLNTAQNTFNDAGSYSVSATDVYGCASTDSFNVFLLEEPTAIIDEDHSGFIYLFDGTSSNYVTSNSTYSWDFGNGQTSTNSGETITYPWANSSAPITYIVSLTVNNGCGEHTTQMEITPDPLGVGSVKDGGFTLYPNPTADVVNFTLANAANSEGTIEVMDLSGRVLSHQIITKGQTNGLISLTDIAAGTYSVRVDLEDRTFTTVVVKQ